MAGEDSLQMRSKHLRPRAWRGAEVDGSVNASEQVVFFICNVGQDQAKLPGLEQLASDMTVTI